MGADLSLRSLIRLNGFNGPGIVRVSSPTRTAIDYRIEVRNSQGNWEYVAGSSDRRGSQTGARSESDYQFEGFDEAEREQGLRWLEALREAQSKIKAIEAERVVYVGQQFAQPGLTHRLYRGEPGSPREAGFTRRYCRLSGLAVGCRKS